MRLRPLPPFYLVSPEVIRAVEQNLPVVALESAVISHGLPFPKNIQLAQDVENAVRAQGVVPATIGVINGIVHAGMNLGQMETLARGRNLRKISSRDFASAIVKGESGGATVAGTMAVAHAIGIQVFATGGIGGVHRQLPGETSFHFDISADLEELARTPMIVVCAGAKAILDLPATLEYLETAGVPVVGYQIDDFPAFYSQSSGLKVTARVENPEQAALIFRTHQEMGMKSAMLLTVPPPASTALPVEKAEKAIRAALTEAGEQKIVGAAVTPFLLNRVSELTGGESLRANLGLLRNNAQVAASVARYLVSDLHLRRA